MDVEVRDRLAGRGTAVHADVETVGTKVALKIGLCCVKRFRQGAEFFGSRFENIRDVPLGDDQRMTGRNRVGVADRQSQV